MCNRIIFSWVGLIVLSTFAWSQCPPAAGQQDAPAGQNTFAQVLKNEVRGLSQTSIDEIVEIRKRLGGGTGLELTEQVDLTDPHWQNQIHKATKSSLDHQHPSPDSARTASERLFFVMLCQADPVHVGRTITRENGQHNSVRLADIRETARRADQLAADLEELELFVDADALRTLASQIRRKARPRSRTAGTRQKNGVR